MATLEGIAFTSTFSNEVLNLREHRGVKEGMVQRLLPEKIGTFQSTI